MRHARITTTEQYMAYAPRPELAHQITRALDPRSLREHCTQRPVVDDVGHAALLARLEEEIPAKWLRELERVLADTAVTQV
jgi:hypothetical protein